VPLIYADERGFRIESLLSDLRLSAEIRGPNSRLLLLHFRYRAANLCGLLRLTLTVVDNGGLLQIFDGRFFLSGGFVELSK